MSVNVESGSVIENAGIGLRLPHYSELAKIKPSLGFLEIHPENYFHSGPHIEKLEFFSSIYPISFHAVGLSLGSAQKVSKIHLEKIKKLINKIKPILFSDHVSWSASGNAHANDLLPLPYNKESLEVISDNINLTQDYLSRKILIENPSSYLSFKSEMSEVEFMNAIVNKTGCEVLLDLNNIIVNSYNHGFCAIKYLEQIDEQNIGEIHLAGHTIKKIANKEIRIDSHSNKVCDDVWDLYENLISQKGVFPTLIEWDNDIPSLKVLLDEVKKANGIVKNNYEKNCAA